MRRDKSFGNKFMRFAACTVMVFAVSFAFAVMADGIYTDVQPKALRGQCASRVHRDKSFAVVNGVQGRNRIGDLVAGAGNNFLRSRGNGKLDSGLAGFLDVKRSIKVANQFEDSMLDCEVLVVDVDAAVKTLQESGCQIVSKSRRFKSIHAYIPAARLSEIVGDDSILRIKRVVPPRHNKADTTAGDIAHRAATARQSYGLTGSGVKIGVISNSVRYLSNVQSSGDLPGSITVLPGMDGAQYSGSLRIDSGEGTAMLEIVHDLCPGAQLFFATAGLGTEAELAEAVLALGEAGCDIIVDDICLSSEPAFQDGIVAQAVNEVSAAGCIYVTCAANKGNLASSCAAVWEGDFTSAGSITIDGVEYEIHGFGSNGGDQFTYLNYWMVGSSTAWGSVITLQWSDAVGNSANDYDLALFDPDTGTFVQFACNHQNGSGCDPYEEMEIGYNGNGSYWGASDHNSLALVILKLKNAQSRYLRLSCFDGPDEDYGNMFQHTTTGQIYGHNAAEAAISVAAAKQVAGRAFTSSDVADYYSSDGPRRVFYNALGSAYTTSLLSGGGRSLQKPDVMGASGVSCATPGFNPFYGTSAAAPHIAAIVGLMLEANPDLTTEEVKDILMRSSFSSSGWTTASGCGAINAEGCVRLALESNPAATPTIPAAPSPYVDGTTLRWSAVAGANYYKVYRATNPYAEPEEYSGWQSGTSKSIVKPSSEGTAYFWFVKAASAQDDKTASGFSGTKVVTGDSNYTLLPYSSAHTHTTYNEKTEFHLYPSTSAISATPYSGNITLTSTITFTKSAGSGITAKINGTDVSSSPTIGNSGLYMGSASFAISSASNTSTTPRSCLFHSNATAPSGYSSSDGQAFGKHYREWYGRPHYIYQAGVASTSIGQTSQSVPADGGSYSVSVTATPSTTSWTASVNRDWVHLYRTSSNGSGVLGYDVEPNDGSARSATITVAGKTLSVSQAAGVTAITRPTNDNYANAANISGAAGYANGSNENATREVNEPYVYNQQGTNTVWWAWTAPATGVVVFDTKGSDFDTVMAAYAKASSVSALGSKLDSNDDDSSQGSSYRQSKITFDTASSSQYRIVVAGYSSNYGSVKLNWQQYVKVSFNGNGATSGAMSVQTNKYNTATTLPSCGFSRSDGYEFDGWATSAGGSVVYAPGASPKFTSNTTLYAHWTPNTSVDEHEKVQLWEGGPYWATTNIGADKPEDSGLYFWWGDTVGYKRENNAWVASDGSSSDFSFDTGIYTYFKSRFTLQSEGWVVSRNGKYFLASTHDAAQVKWGGSWRMPTDSELSALNSNCDWTWTTQNGVNGYVVCGRGDYASNSIFIPCAGCIIGTLLYYCGSDGYYWSSVLNSDSNDSDYYYSWEFVFGLSFSKPHTKNGGRSGGLPIRPVHDVGVTANTYDISYKLNGGTHGTTHPSPATYGTAFKVSAPSRTGYTFTGWTVTSGLNTSTAKYGTSSSSQTTSITSTIQICFNGVSGDVWFINLTSTANGSVTLTANWSANTYSVTYDLDGGTHGTTHPSPATYDEVFYVSAPTKSGHTFAGWTVTNGLDISTAKWGKTSSPSTSLTSSSTKCENGATGNVYFKNLRPTTGNVALKANWTCNHASTVVQNARAATCTVAGYTGDTVCSTCGATISTGSTIQALGHQEGAGVVTKEPTTTEEGVMTYSCTRCGIIMRTEAIPKVVATYPDLGFATFTNWNFGYSMFTTTNSESDVFSCAPVRLFNCGEPLRVVHGYANFGDAAILNVTVKTLREMVSDVGNRVAKTTQGTLSLESYWGARSATDATAWTNLTAGVYTAIVTLDADNVIAETNRANNVREFVFAIRDPLALGAALGCSNLALGTNGDDWYGTRDGSDKTASYVRTKHLGNYGTNVLSTTVSGAGTLSFDWKVSSEKNYDWLEFLVDGVITNRISGTNCVWQGCSYELAGGNHTVEWRYRKDDSYYDGFDCAWLANVEWSPVAALPDICPYTPTGWSGELMLSTESQNATSSTATSFSPNDVIYVSHAAINLGTGFSNDFRWALYVDGSLRITGANWGSGLSANGYSRWQALPIGPLSVGTHTIRVVYDYTGLVAESNESNNTVTKTVTVAGSVACPSNDNFADATVISGMSGSVTGANVNATSQSGEPLPSISAGATNTIWWTWIAPATGIAQFSTDGSKVSYTAMGAYVGSSVSALTAVAASADSHSQSSISFAVVSGTRYYIAVSGTDYRYQGTIKLNWSMFTPVPLDTALDNASLTFTMGGAANWVGVSDESYFGGSSARSGAITHSQTTWMQTEVSGEGTLSFWYKVSSESNWDKLIFYIDGVQKATASGTGSDWWQFEFVVSNSTQHVFKWVYSKDGSVSTGSDCCWVDKVEWTPANIVIDVGDGKSVTVPSEWLVNITEQIEAAGGDVSVALQATAANGRLSNLECYILGLDPEKAEDDFRIVSFPMKADGTPDIGNIVFDPPQTRWNVPATYKVKGAPLPTGPWGDVPSGGNPAYRFFKVSVEMP